MIDDHSPQAFAEIAHLTVGDFRNWLLSSTTDADALTRIAAGPHAGDGRGGVEADAQSGSDRGGAQTSGVTRFRNTIGLPGHMSVRLQPNHPTDDVKGIAASMLDGLMYGCGDAVIGINPATDNLAAITKLLADDRRVPPALSDADAIVRADPRHQHDRRDRKRRAGRSGVPVDRRHGEGERGLRHFARAAAGSA